MVQIWRPGDNFCAFETLSKMADLKFFSALIKKTPIFLLPYCTFLSLAPGSLEIRQT
jgi:hypothetical protein